MAWENVFVGGGEHVYACVHVGERVGWVDAVVTCYTWFDAQFNYLFSGAYNNACACQGVEL